MKNISVLVDKIDEEIDSAKDYAQEYLTRKSKNDDTWMQRFKELANDELKHAVYMHELAVDEINRLSEIYTPPVAMQEAWDKSHARYVEKIAWIKQMLAM